MSWARALLSSHLSGAHSRIDEFVAWCLRVKFYLFKSQKSLSLSCIDCAYNVNIDEYEPGRSVSLIIEDVFQFRLLETMMASRWRPPKRSIISNECRTLHTETGDRWRVLGIVIIVFFLSLKSLNFLFNYDFFLFSFLCLVVLPNTQHSTSSLSHRLRLKRKEEYVEEKKSSAERRNEERRI